jgi:rhodanese-related sulfurtransferase
MSTTITAADLAASTTPYTLIDVRSPGEFTRVHAAGAHLVPIERFDPSHLPVTPGAEQGPIYLICATDTRARMAARQAEAAGLGQVVVVSGGTAAWVAAGLPVVRGRGAISIERQVRIGAGSMVVLGVILERCVHPFFLGLAVMVGCGLVVAGITDFCGMGRLLAKCPWNRRAGSATTSS